MLPAKYQLDTYYREESLQDSRHSFVIVYDRDWSAFKQINNCLKFLMKRIKNYPGHFSWQLKCHTFDFAYLFTW